MKRKKAMMKKTRPQNLRWLIALLASLLITHASLAAMNLPIVADTYLDSAAPAQNFGGSSSVKVLISSDGSACRGLFRLPDELIALDPEKIAQANVCFFVFKNQTAGRTIRLFPLLQSFTPGTGQDPADGTTWETCDGTTTWATPGGDFDTNVFVTGHFGTDKFCRWDITEWLTHPTIRSNLVTHGALLQIEETPIPENGTPRAPFTSSRGALAERPYVAVTLAAPQTLPITNDTYMDSRAGSEDKNFGSDRVIKTVINASDGSICRGLFQLPPELATYDPAEILSAKVWLYVWRDMTDERNITLYPLSRPFIPGTGQTPANGATWNTSDGANAWATPGGDFDTRYPVVGVKGEILGVDHDRFFTWELAPLLTNETARAQLLNNGALLQIDETLPASGMPRAPFTSADDSGYAALYRPRLVVQFAVPTPQIQQMTMTENQEVALVIGETSSRIPLRIERTPELSPTNVWTVVTNVTPGSAGFEWSEPLPPGWPRAFYRVIAEP